MQIFIGSAKTMATPNTKKKTDWYSQASSEPVFREQAHFLAQQMREYSAAELQDMLRINPQLAQECWMRYQHFGDPALQLPAVLAYDGIVFKKMAPALWNDQQKQYADSHLIIGSYLYGLLRPSTLISPYRLEAHVTLPECNFLPMPKYWRPILTDVFINWVKADDGILINLASKEFKEIFDWKRIEKELNVVTPEFKVYRNGVLKTVVVYAKMGRGEMAGWIIRNQPQMPAQLGEFTSEEGIEMLCDFSF